MGLVLACAVRILHDDWPIRLGENGPDRVFKHLAAMLADSYSPVGSCLTETPICMCMLMEKEKQKGSIVSL